MFLHLVLRLLEVLVLLFHQPPDHWFPNLIMAGSIHQLSNESLNVTAALWKIALGVDKPSESCFAGSHGTKCIQRNIMDERLGSGLARGKSAKVDRKLVVASQIEPVNQSEKRSMRMESLTPTDDSVAS